MPRTLVIVATLPSGRGRNRSRAVRKSRSETSSASGSFSNPSGMSDSFELMSRSMSSRKITCFLASPSSSSTADGDPGQVRAYALAERAEPVTLGAVLLEHRLARFRAAVATGERQQGFQDLLPVWAGETAGCGQELAGTGRQPAIGMSYEAL